MAEPTQINIQASLEELKGRYANLVSITHTAEEFLLDFATMTPPNAVLVSRVILSPAHAKRMIQAMSENVKLYEQKQGEIKAAVQAPGELGFTVK